MSGHVTRVALYRFRAGFARRWPGYLGLVLLIALIGGLALASVAGARRTQSSYPTFVASTNPSDLTMAVFSSAGNGSAGPSLKKEIERLPDVKRVRTVVGPTIVPLSANGAPRLNTLGFVTSAGSTDGMFTHQDRLAITQGRNTNPNRADEIVMTTSAARILGVHVGEVVPLGLYSPAQQSLPGFGTPKVAPVVLVRATLVGIAVLNSEVVQDGVDQSYGFIFVTSAFLREINKVVPGHGPSLYGIQLKNRDTNIAKVENELLGIVPKNFTSEFHVTSRVTSQVELAIKPESVALGTFGVIAALACLVLAAEAISRLLREGEEDRRVMRSLGASPATSISEGLIGVLSAIVIGSLAAVLVAAGLSPLAPLGPVRPVYPSRGFAFDWTVLGVGFVVLVFVIAAFAVTLSLRRAPHRVGRVRQTPLRHSSAVRTSQAMGMSVAGVVGVNFALESGRGRTAVPVRSILVGTVLAVAMVVATLTFASGLSTLVSHPALYGWNWSYALNPSNNVPLSTLTMLKDDPDVAAYSGLDYTDAEINGQTFPILLTKARAKVSAPILSGHGLESNDQIVLGAATMALLHDHLGDTVVFSYGSASDAPIYVPPTKLVIVGTATLPAIGYSSYVAEHTSMGDGAIIPLGVLPPAMVKSMKTPDPNLNGPEFVLVRLRERVSAAAGRANLQRIATAANKTFASDPKAAGYGVSVLGVVRPAQIVNYRSIGSTPIVLAGTLAVGAMGALGWTLNASVRRRRRDLALLRTLGFTKRQLTTAIAWQATVDAVVGIIIGIPLGIFMGRELWTLFARTIDAVPDATVPILSVLFVGLGTLVFTNLVAVLPGLSAARTPSALVLRAE